MFCLDDVGRSMTVECDYVTSDGHLVTGRVEVAMVIEAPRGRATIFKPNGCDDLSYSRQGEAVRAFMEQHRGE